MLNMRTNLIFVLVAIFESVSCWNLQHDGGVVQLAVIGERPLSIAKTMVQVPLVLMPNNDVTLYSNVHISSVSPTEPLVTSLNSPFRFSTIVQYSMIPTICHTH
uniref:Putative pisatin demethylase n=1 Tax=Panstrongylus lignarius TaxID=156445 RepID=A0A224Y2P5_9HEMI